MRLEHLEVKSLSCVPLFATPWTAAYKAPLSREFSRQEYWSGLPFPSPGDLPNPGIEPRSPALQANALPSEPPGKPFFMKVIIKLFLSPFLPRKRHFQSHWLLILCWLPIVPDVSAAVIVLKYSNIKTCVFKINRHRWKENRMEWPLLFAFMLKEDFLQGRIIKSLRECSLIFFHKNILK